MIDILFKTAFAGITAGELVLCVPAMIICIVGLLIKKKPVAYAGSALFCAGIAAGVAGGVALPVQAVVCSVFAAVVADALLIASGREKADTEDKK